MLKKYADYLDPNVRGEWPLIHEEKMHKYLVDLPRGIIMRSSSDYKDES
ncbi:MAG: hypothetical protein KA436_11940 [Oligoflexales bacterium]|nr:hypothetical protein [Oligoflexales bacterium]